jgi:hypothetical protein
MSYRREFILRTLRPGLLGYFFVAVAVALIVLTLAARSAQRSILASDPAPLRTHQNDTPVQVGSPSRTDVP